MRLEEFCSVTFPQRNNLAPRFGKKQKRKPCQINNPGTHPTAKANELQCEFVCILYVTPPSSPDPTHACTQTETERQEAERRSFFWQDDAQQQGAAEIVRAQNHHLAVAGKLFLPTKRTHKQQYNTHKKALQHLSDNRQERPRSSEASVQVCAEQ